VTLAAGTRLGAYDVLALIGAGGMGEVYKAHDTRLHRDVAIKVLHDSVANDPDRLARFQREAQVLASLNHPNIGGIYGLEEADGVRGLVLELVDGPTLADRIAAGPIPLDDALAIARQIADALEAAHEHGIVHRDLKPANIKLKGASDEVTVKVLDFGLAKALDPGSSGSSLSMSPTITSPAMTQRGMILGTAAYMAPEQARGRATDKRADIWAFGCVLYEMLTGRRAFGGEDVAETIGAVIHKEPDWDRIPARVRPLLQRCLEKDPKRRLRDIGDAMALLELAPHTASPGPVNARRQWLAWGTAALFLITTVALSLIHFGEQPPATRQVRFQIPPPEKAGLGPYFLLSPDGRSLAFAASDQTGRIQLWVHSLDSGESRPLPRAGAVTSSLVWSPDGRFIAFSQDGKVKKVDTAGGSPQTVCDLPNNTALWAAGTWNADDVIVFGIAGGGLMRVSAAGGVASPLTVLNRSEQETGHAGPKFLPDGRHFLYLRVSSMAERTGIYVGSLDATPEQQSNVLLLATPMRPVYSPSSDPRVGYLLFLRDRTLMAQRFHNDRRELVGEAFAVAEDVGSTATVTGVSGHFSVSTNGVLSYHTGGMATGTPVWVDRTGRELMALASGVLDGPAYPRLSPDGRRFALVVSGDVWVYDLEGRPPIKLTFDGNHYSPLWTPDGRHLVYEAASPSPLLSLPADGSGGAAQEVSPPGHFHPHGWSQDGREIVVVQLANQKTRSDILRFPPDEKAKPQAVVQTQASEGDAGAAVSPDGRWLAYVSDVTGGREIWVQPYPGPGAPTRVSPNGGAEPVWARDGRELFYIEGTKLMSVVVDTKSGFNFKPAVSLFESRYLRSDQPPSYDVAPDGRFLMIKSAEGQTGSPITVVLNWDAGLKK
jgi:eukaryotic-like serine/threonine-protein kinase